MRSQWHSSYLFGNSRRVKMSHDKNDDAELMLRSARAANVRGEFEIGSELCALAGEILSGTAAPDVCHKMSPQVKKSFSVHSSKCSAMRRPLGAVCWWHFLNQV